jgi:hypothetical protein
MSYIMDFELASESKSMKQHSFGMAVKKALIHDIKKKNEGISLP